MLTIPLQEEVRAALAAIEENRELATGPAEQQAEQIRRLVVRELRQAVEEVRAWITDQQAFREVTPGSQAAIALQGAIADSIATGLEIGLIIGEARGWMQRSQP